MKMRELLVPPRAFFGSVLLSAFFAVYVPAGAAQVIELDTELFSFGAIDETGGEVIGEVRDLVADDAVGVLFSDRQFERVGWIRSDETFGGWFGGAGDGPHE